MNVQNSFPMSHLFKRHDDSILSEWITTTKFCSAEWHSAKSEHWFVQGNGTLSIPLIKRIISPKSFLVFCLQFFGLNFWGFIFWNCLTRNGKDSKGQKLDNKVLNAQKSVLMLQILKRHGQIPSDQFTIVKFYSAMWHSAKAECYGQGRVTLSIVLMKWITSPKSFFSLLSSLFGTFYFEIV